MGDLPCHPWFLVAPPWRQRCYQAGSEAWAQILCGLGHRTSHLSFCFLCGMEECGVEGHGVWPLPLTSLLCIGDMEVTRVPLIREAVLVILLPCCACHSSRWLPCTHCLLFLVEPGDTEQDKCTLRRLWGTKDVVAGAHEPMSAPISRLLPRLPLLLDRVCKSLWVKSRLHASLFGGAHVFRGTIPSTWLLGGALWPDLQPCHVA